MYSNTNLNAVRLYNKSSKQSLTDCDTESGIISPTELPEKLKIYINDNCPSKPKNKEYNVEV